MVVLLPAIHVAWLNTNHPVIVQQGFNNFLYFFFEKVVEGARVGFGAGEGGILKYLAKVVWRHTGIELGIWDVTRLGTSEAWAK